MKVVCDQNKLNFALEVVSKAVTPNNTLPILNNILIKASGKKLFFTGTNLEIAINFFIQAEVVNEGQITVPAKLLTSYINLLEDKKVELKVEEGFVLSIKTNTSQTKIKGLSSNEFPVIPKIEKENTFNIQAGVLGDAINSTVFSAAVTPTRPVLCGVLFKGEKDTIRLVATDSYRLAEKKIKPEKKIEHPFEYIVPLKTLIELWKILSMKYEKEIIEIQVSKNQIMFLVDSLELISRLIEGRFPDYEKIIPRATKTKIQVETSRLTLATRRVSLFAKENNNNIKISATNDGKMHITTDETRVGEEKAELDIKISGENNKVAINSQYLLDVLNHIENSVSIEMDEKLTPVTVRPVKGEDYTYIIMPLKI